MRFGLEVNSGGGGGGREGLGSLRFPTYLPTPHEPPSLRIRLGFGLFRVLFRVSFFFLGGGWIGLGGWGLGFGLFGLLCVHGGFIEVFLLWSAWP